MRKLICAGLLLLSSVSLLKAQAVQQVQTDGSGELMELTYDFDGDGRKDVFAAVESAGGDDPRLMAKIGKRTLYSKPLSMCCGSISQKKGVIDVNSKGMRGFTYYKFRWDPRVKDFRLIGYATESLGNAANDGSGKSSLNLLTGDYEAAFNSWNEKREQLVALPKVRRKIAVGKRIYLQQFDDTIDEWLAALNSRQLPKELR